MEFTFSALPFLLLADMLILYPPPGDHMSIDSILPCPFCSAKPKEMLLEACISAPPSKGADGHHDVMCQTDGCQVQNRAIYNKAWNMVAGDKDTLHEAIKHNWV